MIRRIQICNFGSIREELPLECGQLTLICGPMGSGKSMILQSISLALAPHGVLPRAWCRDTENRAHVRFELTTPVLGDLVIDRYFRISKRTHRFRDSETLVNGHERCDNGFLQHLLQPIYFEAYGPEDFTGARNFLRYCSRLLGLQGRILSDDLKKISSVFDLVNRRPTRLFQEVTLNRGTLWLKHWDKKERFPLETAGGGDRTMLSSDFALEVAGSIGEYRDVLLLLDDFPTRLNPIERFAARYRQMSSPAIQVIMTSGRGDLKEVLRPDVFVELTGSKIDKAIYSNRPELALIENAIREFKKGQEDEFIETLVMPTLNLLGFNGVRRVAHHGPGELGFDIGPASREVLPGRVSFFGFQVKAGPVDARSNQSGSITELISQLKKMLSARVLDPVTQTSMHIDYAVAVVSQHLSAEAKRLWENEFEGERRVLLWDAANLAEIIFKARIWPRLPISFRISSNA